MEGDYEQRKIQMKLRRDQQRERVASAQPMTVVGFDMPFMDMVTFMVKWALATIPAAAILFGVGFAVIAVFAGFRG